MVKKVVFISSLPHCGSTLTDFIIGTNKKAISFGEVQGVILRLSQHQDINITCSCGEDVSKCKVFSKLAQNVKDKKKHIKKWTKHK